MPYNLTGLATNTTGMLSLVQGINSNLTGGWLGILLLLGFVTMFFIAFYTATNDISRSISAASFIAFGLSVLMAAISLVPPLAVYIALISTAGALAFTWKKG